MFEWNAAKSKANLVKHGIDFEQAQEVFADTDAVRIEARSDTEPRYALIGAIDGKHWTVFFTLREAATRIFSARRARTAEVKVYEQEKRKRRGA
jgi:uncharacterized DUF497 family protein